VTKGDVTPTAGAALTGCCTSEFGGTVVVSGDPVAGADDRFGALDDPPGDALPAVVVAVVTRAVVSAANVDVTLPRRARTRPSDPVVVATGPRTRAARCAGLCLAVESARALGQWVAGASPNAAVATIETEAVMALTRARRCRFAGFGRAPTEEVSTHGA